MNNLLLFFAIPVATILLSIVLEYLLKKPVLVAITFFAIYLVLTFSVFEESFLIYAIIYTIFAYITAVITRFIERITRCKNQGSSWLSGVNNQEEAEVIDLDQEEGLENIKGCNYRSNCKYLPKRR